MSCCFYFKIKSTKVSNSDYKILFTDDTIKDVENSKESTKKIKALLELSSTFGMVTEHKVTIKINFISTY